MTGPGAGSDLPSGGPVRGLTAREVGHLAGAVGRALVVSAAPLLAAVLLVSAPSPAAAFAWAARAMGTALWPVGGSQWAFRVAALAGLWGTWLLGLSLVVRGLAGERG